jgi:hypothetical protein
MPQYHVDTNDDGSVRRIVRDGVEHSESVSLEQLYSIVTLYFKVAASNIAALEVAEEKPLRRAHGVQSFVMSLTGLEAFANTYFKLRAGELGNQRMTQRIEQRHGSVTMKIRDLLALTPEERIEGQDMILARLHELSQLRNALVHPQWEPSSLTVAGRSPFVIGGLVQNFQAAFEDHDFCREAYLWCLLLIARVGRSRGHADASGFLFHWAGVYGSSEQHIREELRLAAEADSAA